MKIYTFQAGAQRLIGAEWNGQLIDLAVAYNALRKLGKAKTQVDRFPSGIIAFIKGGPALLAAAEEALNFASRRPAMPVEERLTYFFEEVKILAPVPRPGKMLFVGNNYKSHITENPNAKIPDEPFFFSKMPSVVIGTQESIVLPNISKEVDYEVELAVVIGQKLKGVNEKEAMAGVAGYTIINDVSARDIQFKDHQITLGKNFDTFCPMGPCMVTADEIPDPSNLTLRCYVDDELRQEGSTSDWIFPLPKLLSHLSKIMTLEPGDIVSTGTPAGVGCFRKPPVFLQNEDMVRMEIEKIGRLENPVVSPGNLQHTQQNKSNA